MARRVIVAAVLCVSLAGVWVAPAAAIDGCAYKGCIGIAIVNMALGLQGAAYRLGEPPRQHASVAGLPGAADCSGLVWWSAQNVIPELHFPGVSQEQWNFGGQIAGDLWSGAELPRGTLLFLHDENPALGGGATHVSVYIANGEAMDCYNEGFGCQVHNVREDNYYRDHWLGATYPWGDKPDGVADGPLTTGRGVGSGQIPAIIGQPGATYNEFASPVVALGAGVRGPIALAETATGDKDGAAIATENLSGFAEVVAWGKALDFFMPLHLGLALGLVLLILLVKAGLSILRWFGGFIP